MNLSLIIVSYNTKELLKKCLESVSESLQQSTNGKQPKAVNHELSAEIIVVDNNSSDESAKMVEKQFSQVKLIINHQNVGFAKAVNQALKLATEDNFLLLNPDTVVKKKAIEELLTFEEKNGPAIIGAKLIFPDGKTQPSVFNLPTIGRAMAEYWFGRKHSFSGYVPEGNEPIEVEAVVGGAMLIPREIIEKVGFLDERYFMYFEDLDYCRRVKKAGFKVYYLPSAEILHEHGASGRIIAAEENQWRRLIPSSKKYHGLLGHYLINFIIRVGKKF